MFTWQMFFATVVAFWPFLMADGIAIVADGIATFVMTDVIVIMEMENHFVTADVFTVADETVTIVWLM